MNIGLVSVIVPVYNRENYVSEALESILGQTYQNIEIMAVNDGSTDNSLAILKEYQNKYPNKVFVIDQENQGQTRARNNAISQSKGEYIAFLDSDDLWMPEKLEKQLPLFDSNVGLVYCGIHNIDETGKIIDTELCHPELRGNIYNKLLIRNRMTGGTVVIRRDAINRVGMFDVEFPAAENWDLWLRISKLYSVDYVNEALVKYRKHSGNMSQDRMLMLNIIKKILAKHCNEKPSTQEEKAAYSKAHANYAYRMGIYFISERDYRSARRYFREALDLCPNYKDARLRLIRSYLGPGVNEIISKIGRLIAGRP